MITRYLFFILIATLFVGCGTQATPNTKPTDEPEAAAVSDETDEVDDETDEDEDVSEGEVLFKQFYEDAQFACSTCHYPDSDNRLLGPGLLSIEERYQTYDVETESLEAYIKQSILEPREFIVPDDSPYPENIMPNNYDDIFDDDELEDLIEYILSF